MLSLRPFFHTSSQIPEKSLFSVLFLSYWCFVSQKLIDEFCLWSFQTHDVSKLFAVLCIVYLNNLLSILKVMCYYLSCPFQPNMSSVQKA